MSPDLINGIFELGGGLLLTINIIALYRDKMVRGIRVVPTSFFMVWGYWNLWFYPSVDCWTSFWGGVFVTIANTIWVIQMIYYKRKEKRA